MTASKLSSRRNKVLVVLNGTCEKCGDEGLEWNGKVLCIACAYDIATGKMKGEECLGCMARDFRIEELERAVHVLMDILEDRETVLKFAPAIRQAKL